MKSKDHKEEGLIMTKREKSLSNTISKMEKVIDSFLYRSFVIIEDLQETLQDLEENYNKEFNKEFPNDY